MRIFQVLDALDYGDGVSNDVISKHHLFIELGYESYICCKWYNDKVAKFCFSIDELVTTEEDLILHHFSGYSHIMDSVINQKGRKILVYHNITPAVFLEGNKKELIKGERQLCSNENIYECFFADSDFNIKCLRELGIRKECYLLPIMVEAQKSRRKKSKPSDTPNVFLFVGRIAPNKRQEDIIDIFYYYYSKIDYNSVLYLVGNYDNDSIYYNKLKDKVYSLCIDDVVFFVGKVTNEELENYYREADVFLCMSEHEGFCVPILESMSFDVLTVAYDSTAVSSTMGNGGIIIKNKKPDIVAKLIYIILNNEKIKRTILLEQKNNLKRYSKSTISNCLVNLINRE